MKNLAITSCIALLQCLLLLPHYTYAQSGKKQDVVYLKNGSIIRGELQSNYTDAQVKIETKDHSVWVFERSEVDSITREPIPYNLPVMRTRGSYHVLGFGPSMAKGQRPTERLIWDFSTELVNGYRFNSGASIGLMTGAHFYDNQNIFMVPLALDFRGDMFERNVTPIYFAQAGYAWPDRKRDGGMVDYTFEGGTYLSVGTGVKMTMSEEAALLFSLSYRRQRFDRISPFLNGEATEAFTFSRMVFSINIVL